MAARGNVRAEIARVADLLDRTPESLAYLEALEPSEIRAIRDAATDALFDADRDRFARVAAASKLPPVAATAAIAQKAFNPLLVSRVAALAETDRAIEIAKHLRPAFLVDVAVEIDPRRASPVVGGMPPERTALIAGELAARGEFVAMGRFVGHLTREGIVAALERIDDPALLRISFLMEERERLDEVVTLLGPSRQADAIRAACEHDLWIEALDLLDSLSVQLRASLLEIAAGVMRDEATEAQRAGALAAARDAGALETLGPLRAALES